MCRSLSKFVDSMGISDARELLIDVRIFVWLGEWQI